MNDSLLAVTAYVKMLDVWMLASLLLPFSEIISLVLRKEVSCIRTNGRFQFSREKIWFRTFRRSHWVSDWKARRKTVQAKKAFGFTFYILFHQDLLCLAPTKSFCHFHGQLFLERKIREKLKSWNRSGHGVMNNPSKHCFHFHNFNWKKCHVKIKVLPVQS